MNPLQKEDHNGWTNYETWNVALHIRSDEALYKLFKLCKSYAGFKHAALWAGVLGTPDMVRFDDRKVNVKELNEKIFNYEFTF